MQRRSAVVRCAAALTVAVLISTLSTVAPGQPASAAGGAGWSLAATVPVGPGGSDVTVDAGGVWVTTFGDASVWRVDPASNAARLAFPVPVEGDGGPEGIAAGFGSLWVTVTSWKSADEFGPGHVVRLDPATGSVLATIDVGRGNYEIATSADAIWVANSEDGTLMRIDPTKDAVAATVTIPGTGHDDWIWDLAVSDTAVWLTTEHGALVRVDPTTRAVTLDVDLDALGACVSVAGGMVWVSSDGARKTDHARILRVDPATGRILATVDLPAQVVGALAAGGPDVWAAMYGEASAVRIDAASTTVAQSVPTGAAWSMGVEATATDAWVVGTLADLEAEEAPPTRVSRISLAPVVTEPAPPVVSWRTALGTSGANGSATLSMAGTSGTLTLALRSLKPSAGYSVKVTKGTCAKPLATLWSAPTQRSTAAGRITVKLTIPRASVTSIRAAAAVGPVSLRIGSGARLKCALLTSGTGPTATPTAVPTPTATPTPSGGLAYFGPYFHVAVPAGWKMGSLPPGSSYGSAGFDGPGSRWLGAYSWELDYTPEQALAAAIDNLKEKTGVDPAKVEDITLGGVPGKMLTFRYTDAGEPRIAFEAHCVQAPRVYELIYTDVGTTEDADRAEFLEIVRSFGFMHSGF